LKKQQQQQKRPEEASTHNSANTHAGNVFAPRPSVCAIIAKISCTHGQPTVCRTSLMPRHAGAAGKTRRWLLRRQRQYCVLSEDPNRLAVTRDLTFDLLS